jgi:hypothetical protein
MTEEPITFTSKVKTRWLLSIFVIIWTIACFAMIGIIIGGLIGTPSRINDFIAIVVILFIAAFFTINYLIWQFKGHQNLTFSEKGLIFSNSGTWFSNRFELSYSELESVTFDNDEKTANWIKIWGIGGGKIIFGYLGRARRFGQDLSLKDAGIIAGEINIEIEKRKTNANTLYI